MDTDFHEWIKALSLSTYRALSLVLNCKIAYKEKHSEFLKNALYRNLFINIYLDETSMTTMWRMEQVKGDNFILWKLPLQRKSPTEQFGKMSEQLIWNLNNYYQQSYKAMFENMICGVDKDPA